VEIVIAGEARDAEAQEEVFVELLARLGVKAITARVDALNLQDIVTPREEPEHRLARAWLSVRGPGRAALYIVDRSWERVLVREVPLSRGLDEIAREELGHILEAAVETLLAGGRVGRPREEVRASLGVPSPSPSPSPPPAATADRRPSPAPEPKPKAPPGAPRTGITASLMLGASWEVAVLSSTELFTHGPAARVALAFERERAGEESAGARPASRSPSGARPIAALSGQYRLPLVASHKNASVRLEAAALRLLGGLELALTERLRIVPAVGAGIDLVHIGPQDASPGTSLDPSRWSVYPLARAELSFPLRVHRVATAELSIAADADLFDTRFYVRRGAASEDVVDPWLVRPSVRVGIVLEPWR
jgi:hypothetical protein